MNHIRVDERTDAALAHVIGGSMEARERVGSGRPRRDRTRPALSWLADAGNLVAAWRVDR